MHTQRVRNGHICAPNFFKLHVHISISAWNQLINQIIYFQVHKHLGTFNLIYIQQLAKFIYMTKI